MSIHDGRVVPYLYLYIQYISDGRTWSRATGGLTSWIGYLSVSYSSYPMTNYSNLVSPFTPHPSLCAITILAASIKRRWCKETTLLMSFYLL